MQPLSLFLREHTQSSHHALDSSTYSTALSAHTLPIAWLERFLRLETQILTISHSLHTNHPWDAVRSLPVDLGQRTQSLQYDRTALPTTPHPNLDAYIEHLPTHLLPLSPSGVLGLLYVVEGSNLGGLVIAQHLRASFPQTTPYMTRFQPPKTAAKRWRGFCEALNAIPLTHEQYTQAAHGAHTAFACFAKGMDLLVSTTHEPYNTDSAL